MSVFDNKITKRLERNASRMNDIGLISTEGAYTIVSNRKYKGVSIDGTVTVSPIYDDVRLDRSLVAGGVVIEGKMAIVDLYSGELLTDFNYDDIGFNPSEHSIILYKDGLKGLFSVFEKRVIEEPSYSDMNVGGGARYGWMFSDIDGYVISDNHTRERTALGFDVDECFDEAYGHIFILRNDSVLMLTSDGMEDKFGYRKLLSSLGGRISLYNSSRCVSVIADIYGHIL